MTDFIEQQIVTAVRGILEVRVNELLGELQFYIPPIKFGDYSGYEAIAPAIALSSCECSEKERIIRLDAYTLTITFPVPETPYSDMYCYAYAASVRKALDENPTLDGVADRVLITGEKYIQPKKPNCGQGWELVISLRITIEGINNAG